MNPLYVSVNEPHALKCEMASEVLRSSGTLRLRVTGWSMLPTVWPGDVLIVERVDSAEVTKGDIVLFARDRRLFAHRVVMNQSPTVITRGDALRISDSPIGENELLGRVSSMIRNGRPIQTRRTLGAGGRAIASLVQRSEVAARIFLRVGGLFQRSNQTA